MTGGNQENDRQGMHQAVIPTDLQPGTIIDERYRIVSFLGRGGMCSVYKAYHLTLERDVAIKFLNRNLIADVRALQRFRQEAVAVSALDHHNIVKVHGFGFVDKDRPFIAMDAIEGQSLADLLREKTRLSRQEALPIFDQILDGLAHAHSKGIIHRDLKPSNIMLTGSDRTVKLVDFGIAKALPESGKDMQKLTQTGELFGTVLYMSPEQCMGTALDARSDIYAMGCVMYETLDGRPAMHASTPYATINKHVGEQAAASEFLNDDFGRVIFGALAKDPHKRPASAVELKAYLHEPASWKASKPSTSSQARRQLMKRPSFRLISMVLFFSTLAATIYFGKGWLENIRNPQSILDQPPPNAEALRKAKEHINDQDPLSPAHLDAVLTLARADYDRALPCLQSSQPADVRAIAELTNSIVRLASFIDLERQYRIRDRQWYSDASLLSAQCYIAATSCLDLSKRLSYRAAAIRALSEASGMTSAHNDRMDANCNKARQILESYSKLRPESDILQFEMANALKKGDLNSYAAAGVRIAIIYSDDLHDTIHETFILEDVVKQCDPEHNRGLRHVQDALARLGAANERTHNSPATEAWYKRSYEYAKASKNENPRGYSTYASKYGLFCLGRQHFQAAQEPLEETRINEKMRGYDLDGYYSQAMQGLVNVYFNLSQQASTPAEKARYHQLATDNLNELAAYYQTHTDRERSHAEQLIAKYRRQ